MYNCCFGSEILGVLLNRADTAPSIEKLIAIIKPNNTILKKVLSKYGFQSEVVLDVADGTVIEGVEKNID